MLLINHLDCQEQTDLDNQLINYWPRTDPDVQETKGLCVSPNLRSET